MTKPAWLFCGTGFVAGLAAGIAVGVYAAHTGAGAGGSRMFDTLKFMELAASDERAIAAYKHGSPPVAIYALSESLDRMKEAEQFGDTQLFSKRVIADEMMLAHARLANVYAQTGETNLATQHIEAALRCSKEAGRASWFTNRDALLDYVAKLDRSAK